MARGLKEDRKKGLSTKITGKRYLTKRRGKNVPIKIKKSQKIRDKNTGKNVTTHYYAKCATIEELHQLIASESTKLKIKNKCRNELTRRTK